MKVVCAVAPVRPFRAPVRPLVRPSALSVRPCPSAHPPVHLPVRPPFRPSARPPSVRPPVRPPSVTVRPSVRPPGPGPAEPIYIKLPIDRHGRLLLVILLGDIFVHVCRCQCFMNNVFVQDLHLCQLYL